MAIIEQEREPIRPEPHEREPEVRASMKTVLAGSVTEGAGGLAVIVLSILGLVGVLPRWMLPISVIVAGASFLLKEGEIAARYHSIVSEIAAGDNREMGSALALEFLGGVAGVALGILALLGIYPLVLSACAVIAFGVMLIVQTDEFAHLQSLGYVRYHERSVYRSVLAALGTEAVVGLGAAVLGIIALTALNNVALATTLTIVGVLCVGSALTIGSAALGGKMTAALMH